MQNISIFFIIEMIGTVAFASSGAMVAIKKELDLLGVVVLGVTTAVGGGMLRDIILGNVPPALFMNPVYVIAGFLTVLVLFTVVRLNQKILESRSIEMYERVMNIFDAVGLGAFTVTGVLRDIMAGQTPYILRKHFYACASIIGAIVYTYLLEFAGGDFAVVVSACLVVVIRLLATRYCWNLPKATKKKKEVA